MSHATFREQNVQEIFVFLILVLFFFFLLMGFTTIGANQDLSSAISSLMVFLVGGRVNIPLQTSASPEEKNRKLQRKIMKEAQVRSKDE